MRKSHIREGLRQIHSFVTGMTGDPSGFLYIDDNLRMNFAAAGMERPNARC